MWYLIVNSYYKYDVIVELITLHERFYFTAYYTVAFKLHTFNDCKRCVNIIIIVYDYNLFCIYYIANNVI